MTDRTVGRIFDPIRWMVVTPFVLIFCMFACAVAGDVAAKVSTAFNGPCCSCECVL